KVMLVISITFFSLMGSIFIGEKIYNLSIELGFWTKYSVIYLIGMLITLLLWEVIQTNFQVLQKLVKAEKIQLVSHLAASISHEVRNPLTASRGFIQMLSEDVSDQTRKSYANIALQELD